MIEDSKLWSLVTSTPCDADDATVIVLKQANMMQFYRIVQLQLQTIDKN